MATKLLRKPSKPTTTAIIQVTFFGAERFILILLVVQLVKTLQSRNVSLAQITEYKHNSYNNKLCKKLRIKRNEFPTPRRHPICPFRRSYVATPSPSPFWTWGGLGWG
jgi:hypothetical protein